MLRFIFLLALIIFPFGNIYAFIESSISLSEDTLQIGDITTLTLEIDASELTQTIDYDIKGIENFEIFSQSQQFQFQNIGGEVQNKIISRLALKANNPGEFKIGPTSIEIGEEIYTDESILVVNVSNTPGISVAPEQSNEDDVLYGLIEENSTSYIKILSYTGFVLGLILLLSYVLFLLSKKPQDKNIWLQQEQDTPMKKISLYEMYFSNLSETDTGEIFMKKYLVNTENYLSKAESSSTTYLSLTLEEIMNLESYKSYILKDDFNTLYTQYYKGEHLSDKDKARHITQLKNIYLHV